MHPWIRIAHRGASGSAPENTLAAFEKAIEIGVDAVELDLHGTADGEVVVIHDTSLDRTTNHCGPVNQTTLETIKRADAGGWFAPEFVGEPVPTLVEALECIAKQTIAVLEIKDPLIAETVVARIRETPCTRSCRYHLLPYRCFTDRSFIRASHSNRVAHRESQQPRLSCTVVPATGKTRQQPAECQSPTDYGGIRLRSPTARYRTLVLDCGRYLPYARNEGIWCARYHLKSP